MKPGERDKLGRVFNVKPKQCRICGSHFRPSNGTQIYCSPTCLRESATYRGECEWCGRAFEKRKQAKPTRYCGVKCSAQATARRRVAELRKPREPCETCGEPRPLRNDHFCSRACRVKAAGPRKRDWSWQQDWGVKKKGEEFCRNCGQRATHLHHIVPRSMTKRGQRDVENNGLPLCFDCHQGWHGRSVTILASKLRPNEWGNAIELAGEFWVGNNYPVVMDDCDRILVGAEL